MRRFLTAAPLLLIAATASAGDKTPPGLERVCERIEPETTTEVVATGFDTATGPACDHSDYSDGRCEIVTRSMAATPSSALGVEVLAITPLSDGTDGPFYHARGFSLDTSADPTTQPVSVWVNGKPLFEKKVLGEPLEISGYMEYSKDTGRWTHVAVAHGAKVSLPTKLDSAILPTGAVLAAEEVKNTDGSTSTFYDMQIEDDDPGDDFEDGMLVVTVEVTYHEADDTK